MFSFAAKLSSQLKLRTYNSSCLIQLVSSKRMLISVILEERKSFLCNSEVFRQKQYNFRGVNKNQL